MQSEVKNGNGMVNSSGMDPINIEEARAILDNKLFGPEKWLSCYGIWFSSNQLENIKQFPWDKNILESPCPFVKGKKVKETHFAFLGIDQFNNKPLDLLKWHELNPMLGNGKPRISFLDEEQDFARVRTCWFKWHLMTIGSIPESFGKTYQEQVSMIPEGYRIPFAVEEIAKNILYYKIQGIYPNYNNWVRCQDKTENSSRPCVGEFVRVRCCLDDKRNPMLGLSAYMKLPSSNSKQR